MLASFARAKIGVRMNATEFQHDRNPIGHNAELQRAWFGSVIGKLKPNRPIVFLGPPIGNPT